MCSCNFSEDSVRTSKFLMSLATLSAIALSASVVLTCALIGYFRETSVPQVPHTKKRVARGGRRREDDALLEYTSANSLRLHPAQEQLIKVTTAHPRQLKMPSPDVIQLICNLLRTISGRKTINIGVYTGYSAMSVALVLPEEGRVVACDVRSEFPNIGRPCWKQAEVSHKIDLRIAPAEDTLQSLLDDGEAGTFDFAFIDADQTRYILYYELCVQLVRPRGIIAVDHVLWGGFVVEPERTDEYTDAVRAFNAHVAQDARVSVSMMRVGDGLSLIFKR